MRVFDLTAHVKSISRGKGRSATAAAAYRACCAIDCEREGRTHDYSRKSGLEASEIVLPDDAPEWACDRAKLWNAAELRERNKDRRAKGKDKAKARPARELLFSFPVELSEAGRLAAARSIARHLADAHGVAADFAIHRPGKDGDQRNFHCHLMWTARRLTAKGLGEKTREWDDLKTGADLTKTLRATVAGILNDALAAEGKASAVHVEHRSFKERGEPDRPTKHEGPGKTNGQRKKRIQARRDWQKGTRTSQDARQGEERAELKASQDKALSAKLNHMAEQERLGIERIRADLARDQAADQPPKGLRRALDLATGRATGDDAARQQRAADRVRVADRTIEAFRKGMQAAREEFIRGQQQDMNDLTARHKAEDRQMTQAGDARVTADRIAEVQARRDRARGQQQTHDHDRSRGL